MENASQLQKLKEMIKAKEDITACVALYLDLYEDTDVMHRDVVENEIEELRNGNDENNMEAGRLELLLKDNPQTTYFDYYTEQPITFRWLWDRLRMDEDPQRDINFLSFLQNGNVVRIRDDNEYTAFLYVLAIHRLGSLLTPRKALYEDVIKLYKLPQNAPKYPGWDGKTLYAECQIGKESIAIYPYSVRATVEWYGTEPMSVDDVGGRI